MKLGSTSSRGPKGKRKGNADRNGPGQHVVGNAASATVGVGTDTEASSDWMEEAITDPAPAADTQSGVPVATRSRGDHQRGRAIESKRGQQ